VASRKLTSGFSVLSVRAGRLFDAFAISPMGTAERNDLLEILDDQVGTKSTLIASQC
jgi:hypothetical protein